MDELKVFENKMFGSVRVVEKDGNPWFVASDVCRALEIKNSRDAVSRLDSDMKATVGITDTSSNGVTQKREVDSINEAGMYALIFKSRKEEAKQFQRWITNEVIPSIRKHGAYMTPEVIEQTLCNPDFIIKLATELKTEQEKCKALEAEKAINAPKLEYYQKVVESKDTVPITIIAKDYGMSAAQMNELLHNAGVQFKVNGTWVLYQQYADCGYTETLTYVNKMNGLTNVHMKWTQKGREFIFQKLASMGIMPARVAG